MSELLPSLTLSQLIGARMHYQTIVKIDEITIKKVERGFIAKVGCKTLVFEKEKDLFSAMSLYFSNPQKAEEKYCEKSGE